MPSLAERLVNMRLPLAESTSASPREVKWNYRKWGTLEDPVHKSQMSTLIGEYACTRQFQYDRQREARGEGRDRCSGKTEMGTAGHETIARALRNSVMRDSILAGAPATTVEAVRKVVEQEFVRAVGNRQVTWYGGDTYADVLEDVTWMVHGLFADMSRHVAGVELVEAGFISLLGDIWIEGHTDLIYRPRECPEGLAFTDWKTGAQRPHQLVLDHGYESGFYSAALERGLFLPADLVQRWVTAARADNDNGVPLDPWDVAALASARDERQAMHIALRAVARRESQGLGLAEGAVQFGRFPDVIRLTHLHDYVPYAKKGTKTVERAEDAAHWSRVLNRPIEPGTKVPFEKGMSRGPAWLHVQRTASDVQRLERMLRAVIGWVRFGRFVEAVGEKCTRCSYRGPCLTSGYELTKDEAKQVNASLRGLDLADADALNIDDD